MLKSEERKYASLEEVLYDVELERDFQNSKWDTQPEWDDPLWCAILGEEFGEACEALLEARFWPDPDPSWNEKLYRELIQVAAVAVAQAQKLRKVMDDATTTR